MILIWLFRMALYLNMKNDIKENGEQIKLLLEYQGIGRKLLMVDEFPQGTMARYEKEIGVLLKGIRKQKYNRLSNYGKRVYNKRFPNWETI